MAQKVRLEVAACQAHRPSVVKALLKCPLSYLIRSVPFFVLVFVGRWPGPERSPAEPAGRSA